MSMDHCQINTGRTKPKYWKRNLSQGHFVQNKLQADRWTEPLHGILHLNALKSRKKKLILRAECRWGDDIKKNFW